MNLFTNKEKYSSKEIRGKLREFEKYIIFYNANRISEQEFSEKQKEFNEALGYFKKENKNEYKKIISRYNDISSRLQEICFFRA
jgi:hypothetical protein